MLKKTRLYVGVSLLVQSVSFILMAILLCVKNKSIWKSVFAFGAIGGIIGCFVTASALMRDRKFKKVLEAVDDLCEPDVPLEDVPVDDIADESEFE